MAYADLASAKTWREARKVVAYRRAEARVAEATKDLAAARLVRYEGIAGTDWEGRPYDEREFEETKTALEFLASVHRARYENGRYRRDLMKIVKGIVSRTLPDEEFVMTIAEDRRSWFAWRRTIGGWYLGIGATGAPTEDWVYLGEQPLRASRALRQAGMKASFHRRSIPIWTSIDSAARELFRWQPLKAAPTKLMRPPEIGCAERTPSDRLADITGPSTNRMAPRGFPFGRGPAIPCRYAVLRRWISSRTT
jgi:hypothetical protein